MIKTFKSLGEGATFSYKNKLYTKQNPEYTPDGRCNAKGCMMDEYIYIRPSTKVEYIPRYF